MRFGRGKRKEKTPIEITIINKSMGSRVKGPKNAPRRIPRSIIRIKKGPENFSFMV